MNSTKWRPEDGQLLQRLRTQAGIDELVFARSNTLSLIQLRELEGGEGQSFYNAQIKRHTGLKLLKKLGFESPPIDSGEPASHSDTLAERPSKHPMGASTNPMASPAPAVSRHSQRAMGLWMGGVLTIGSMVWWLLLGPSTASTHRQQGAIPPSTPPAPTSPAVAALGSESAHPPSSLTGATGQNTAAAPGLASPTVAEPLASLVPPLKTVACADQYRNISASHTPTNPLKPGNYIYIEAKTDSELCVLDSQNQLSILSLKAGMNHTVNGLAPFLVHAQDWHGLQVFFQGRPVRVKQGNDTHLVLNSLPI